MRTLERNSVDKRAGNEYNEISNNEGAFSVSNRNLDSATERDESVRTTSSFLVQNPSEQDIQQLQLEMERILLLSIQQYPSQSI